MRYSFNDIIESLPKKKNSKSSWWVKLWVRKTSFLFTYLFIYLGWSSNAVSYLSVFVSLLACVLFSLGMNWTTIIAIVLINFWLVLDCVDGNIARCMKQKKLYGEFIDAMSGYFTVGFIYLALGVAAFHQSVSFLGGNILILIIGAVASISEILARLIYTNYCGIVRPDSQENEKAKTDDKKSINYLRKRISKELGISGLFMPLTIIGYLFNCYSFIVLFYLCFNGFALISTAVMYAYKANSYDSMRK